MATTNQELSNQLEAMIDRCGLSDIVELIAEICALKAEHVQTNWQDRMLADTWAKDSIALTKLVVKLNH